jgi:hypothetical protein
MDGHRYVSRRKSSGRGSSSFYFLFFVVVWAACQERDERYERNKGHGYIHSIVRYDR